MHYYTIIDNVLYNITCTWQNRVLIFCVDIYLTWKCSIVMLKGVGRHLKPSFRKTFEIWSRIPLNLDHKGSEKPIILIGDEKTNTFLWFHEAGFNPSPWQNGGQWKLTLWPQYYISCPSTKVKPNFHNNKSCIFLWCRFWPSPISRVNQCLSKMWNRSLYRSRKKVGPY